MKWEQRRCDGGGGGGGGGGEGAHLCPATPNLSQGHGLLLKVGSLVPPVFVVFNVFYMFCCCCFLCQFRCFLTIFCCFCFFFGLSFRKGEKDGAEGGGVVFSMLR